MVPDGRDCLNSPDGAALDEIFNTLQDWEHQLKHADIDFEELGL